MTPCPLCGEIVCPGIHDLSMVRYGGLLTHRECALRSVIGGIGHLRDHALWCITRHDPDGGLSYRQSALEVDQWVTRHGINAAVARSEVAG